MTENERAHYGNQLSVDKNQDGSFYYNEYYDDP